jgi:hypothetical protein
VSNLIDFMERLGQDADLHRALIVDLEKALRDAGLEPALKDAILGNDRPALEALAGADGNVCCMIFKEDEEEEPEEEEEEEEGDDEDEEAKDLLET